MFESKGIFKKADKHYEKFEKKVLPELTTKSSGGAVNTLGNNISSLSKQKPPKAKKRFNLSL